MSRVYNVSLGDNFLEAAARIILQEPTQYTVVLPNNRSCREFKSHFLKTSSNLFLPKILPLSACIGTDECELTFEIIDILRKQYLQLPFNILYDLAFSIGNLIKNFILNNSDYSILETHVPTEFRKYWEITEVLFKETLRNPRIQSIMNVMRYKAQSFLNDNKNIALIGLNNSHDIVKKMMQFALKSENGIIITCGLENNTLNSRLIRSIIEEGIQSENVSRGTFNSHVQQAILTSKNEEAFAIAIAVRQQLAAQKSVMVVSPDKELTRQIQAQLSRWNIIADSSIGQIFAQTRFGILFSLILDMLESELDTAAVVNLLKMSVFKEEVNKLEWAFRKQQSVPPNFFEAIKSLKPEENPSAELNDFIDKMAAISFVNAPHTFAEWLNFCLQYTSLVDKNAVSEIDKIARKFKLHSNQLPQMDFSEFSVFFKTHVATQPRTISDGFTPNVTILGAIEAQLLHADFVVIAEANEPAWTSQDNHEFWVTKSMQKRLNIPSADVENEFLQCIFERLINKPEVLITRADVIDGVKQQPYQFYEKIASTHVIENADYITQILADFKRSCPRMYLQFNAPCPPLNARPTKVYATEVESLLNNPYAFYAKKILKLKECSHINENENVRGKYIHDVLHDFVDHAADKTDLNALNASAEKILKNKWLTPAHFGLWYFRLRKIFSFVTANMDNQAEYVTEKNGSCRIAITDNYSIELAARADRIDKTPNDELVIIDYKTGTIPNKSEAISGDKPQLSIEAAIGLRNGFDLNTTNITKMSFWKLDGKAEGGSITDIAQSAEEVKAAVDNMLEKLVQATIKYNIDGEAYNINLHAQYDAPYKHLARVKEWCNAE